MTSTSRGRWSGSSAGWIVAATAALLHGWAIWLGMGGRAGLETGWPIWRDDHPLYFHSALITRRFQALSGTTAGYDPSFMSGYAKSVIFPASSTLPELVIAAFGGSRPERAYKWYVLVSAALIPWLVACAALLWRARGWTAAIATVLFLIYVWTDFPINYAAFGMLPYLLAIPLGLVATGAFCWYVERGGFAWWLAAALLMSAAVLVHLTSAMIVAPAAALTYAVVAFQRAQPPGSFPRSRHAGVWLIPVVVLALNAFWWLPGIWLASTKGSSDFAFSHPEGVFQRLWQIVTVEAPIESVLCAFGLVGLAALARRDRALAAGLAGFLGAGLFWGYLAGGLRALDFLQPGRHTYAFYAGLAVASGFGMAEVLERIRGDDGRCIERWVALGLLLVGLRVFGPAMVESVRLRIRPQQPFLTSEPPPRLRWLIERIQGEMKPGERLLYEEGGFGYSHRGAPVIDPYQGGRFSGLLPWRTGIEVIGGPYLHASLQTNFTQFGEGKLFGKTEWGRDHFVRYARLYRPAHIACYSPWSRGFCRSNPDLVEVLAEEGGILFGRVKGFAGKTIEGTAEIDAQPGRLTVRSATPGVDGTIVLRYHSVPCLRASPPIRWDPVFLEQDPVPFIRLRPPAGPVEFEIRFPPASSSPPAS